MMHSFLFLERSPKLIEVAYYIAKLLHTAAVTKPHSLHILQVLSFVLFSSKQTSDKRKLVYWSKREAVEPPHSSRAWNLMEARERTLKSTEMHLDIFYASKTLVHLQGVFALCEFH